MQTLEKFKQFVDEINLENGRNYKLSVLEKYKDDEVIKKYLQYVFDPFIVFGIAEKKYGKKLEVSSLDGTQFNSIFDLLDWLKINNTGKDEVLKQIYGFVTHNITIPHFSDKEKCIELALLLKSIITKNLILGISGSTINKVFGKNTIHEFNVMLANKYFDKPEVVEGKIFFLTTKIDGMRCVMMKENGNVTFWSRQGQPIEGLVDLEEEAKKCFPDNIVFDGELVANLDNPDTYKETMKRARTKDTEKHGLKMLVFDRMTAEEFRKQCCKDAYFIRRAELLNDFSQFYFEECIDRDSKFDKEYLPNYPYYPTDSDEYEKYTLAWKNDQITFINTKYKYFEILPWLYFGNDTKMIKQILDEQVANGEEGIMINIFDAPYEFKRTNNLLKVKLFNDADLECVGFEEGTNSNKGRLGALLLKYNDNIVKCGSGFSEELREDIWAHQEDWLGRTITVKYFEESYDSKTGKKSLRFPIYVDWREDK